MTPREGQEKAIRETYGLLRKHEEILWLSDRPKEQQWAHNICIEQRDVLLGYLSGYKRLHAQMGFEIPPDIAEITVLGDMPMDDLGERRQRNQKATPIPAPGYQCCDGCS